MKALLESHKASSSIPVEVRKENKKLKRNMQILIMELEESSVVIENKRKRIAALEQKLKEFNRGRKVELFHSIYYVYIRYELNFH